MPCCTCFSGARCNLTNNIEGKIVLITGSNIGIGLQTALVLAKHGGIIHLACRNMEKCENAKSYIEEELVLEDNRIFCHSLDLSSFRSILKFCKSFRNEQTKLDILINNAGICSCPYSFTEDGFESQMGVNHFGHFLLTNQLLDLIKADGGGRIINVSSSAHEKITSLKDGKLDLTQNEYGKWKAYCRSKLANVLHARYLAKLLEKDNVAVVSLHPGVVKTNLGHNMPSCVQMMLKMFECCMKTPLEGAQTSIYCALLPNLMEYTGEYFSDCRVKESPNKEVYDEEMCQFVWEKTKEIVDGKLAEIEEE